MNSKVKAFKMRTSLMDSPDLNERHEARSDENFITKPLEYFSRIISQIPGGRLSVCFVIVLNRVSWAFLITRQNFNKFKRSNLVHNQLKCFSDCSRPADVKALMPSFTKAVWSTGWVVPGCLTANCVFSPSPCHTNWGKIWIFPWPLLMGVKCFQATKSSFHSGTANQTVKYRYDRKSETKNDYGEFIPHKFNIPTERISCFQCQSFSSHLISFSRALSSHEKCALN